MVVSKLMPISVAITVERLARLIEGKESLMLFFFGVFQGT